MRNEPWNNQLDNRNYLSPVGFKFVITKAPKADFFSNSANIPGINLGFAEQPTYLKNMKRTWIPRNVRHLKTKQLKV